MCKRFLKIKKNIFSHFWWTRVGRFPLFFNPSLSVEDISIVAKLEYLLWCLGSSPQSPSKIPNFFKQNISQLNVPRWKLWVTHHCLCPEWSRLKIYNMKLQFKLQLWEWILTKKEIWQIKYFLFYFKYKVSKLLGVHQKASLFKCKLTNIIWTLADSPAWIWEY